jgi:hypothetical protein
MNGSSTAKVVGKNRCPATPWANEVAGTIATAVPSAKQNERHNQIIDDLLLQVFINVLRIWLENWMTLVWQTPRPCSEALAEIEGRRYCRETIGHVMISGIADLIRNAGGKDRFMLVACIRIVPSIRNSNIQI